jgi:hypothetical protein
MKYAIVMGLVVIIYVPSFIKIGSGIQTLIRGRGVESERDRQRVDRISILLFIFSGKDGTLKMKRQHVLE